MLTASVWVDRNGREMVDIIKMGIYVCIYQKQMRIYVLFGKGDAVRAEWRDERGKKKNEASPLELGAGYGTVWLEGRGIGEDGRVL